MFPFGSDQSTRVSAALQFIQVTKFARAIALTSEFSQEPDLTEKEKDTRDAALDLLKEYFEQRSVESKEPTTLDAISEFYTHMKQAEADRQRVAEQAGKSETVTDASAGSR